MKSYLKLVNFELGRFIKIYFVLAGITIVSQIIGTVLMANDYMENLNDAIYLDGLTTEQFLEQFGAFSLMNMFGSVWYVLPIIFAAAALIFYCFFIWYRDWFGKNTFIYRLFMLPTARLNIFFSKATAIFLMVLGLVALQVILLKIASYILKWIVPVNLRVDLSVMELVSNSYGNLHLGLIIPTSFIEFLINYGIGFTAVFVLFTAILFERSYRFKGFIFGILYATTAVIIFLLPEILIISFETSYLYPVELFIVHLILWTLITGMSIWISNYLLNKKVTV